MLVCCYTHFQWVRQHLPTPPPPPQIERTNIGGTVRTNVGRWKNFYIRGRSRGIEGFSSLASRERPTAYPLLLSLHCPASISAEQRWCKTYCQNPFGRFQRFCRDGGGRPEEAQGWRGQGKRNREAGERIGRAQHPRRKKVVLQCAPHNTHKNPQCATPSPPPPPNPPSPPTTKPPAPAPHAPTTPSPLQATCQQFQNRESCKYFNTAKYCLSQQGGPIQQF